MIDKLRTWRETDFGGEPAFVPGVIGNSELAPERTAELEVGFEYAPQDRAAAREWIARFDRHTQRGGG
mgnify:CR=1 FL=1